MINLILYSIVQAFHAMKERLFTKKNLPQWVVLTTLLFFVFIDTRVPLGKFSLDVWAYYCLWAFLILIDRFFEYLFIRKLHKNPDCAGENPMPFLRPALFLTALDLAYLMFMRFISMTAFPFITRMTSDSSWSTINHYLMTGLYYFIIILFLAVRWNIFILLYRERRKYFTSVKKAFIILRENFGTYVIFGIFFLIMWIFLQWGDRTLGSWMGISLVFKGESSLLTAIGLFTAINAIRLAVLLPLHIFLYYCLIYLFYNVTEYPRQEDMPYVMRFLVLRRGG